MNLNKRDSHRNFKKNPGWLLLLASPLVVARVAAMQGLIGNPAPTTTLTPAAMQNNATNNPMTVFVPNGTSVDKSLPQPFQYGPFTVRPHFDYNIIYGSGIQAAPTNHQTTAVQQISPGLAVDLGTHWTLDYTPTIRLYSNRQFQDGVDHSFLLVGGTHYEDWTYGLTQSYLYTTAPQAETAGQATLQTFNTELTANDVLNDKLSLALELDQSISAADGLQGSRDWSTMDWLNYTFWPRLTAGVGAGLGYVNVDNGSDQPYENLQANVSWRATDKLSFQISGGVQARQFLNVSSQTYYAINSNTVPPTVSSLTINPSSDLVTPTFSAMVQYLPFQNTQISLNGSRSVQPALIPGSDTIATSFGASINQGLFKKFNLNLSGSYIVSKYISAGVGVNENLNLVLQDTGRTDDSYNFSARLSHPFFRRGTWAVYYQYSSNDSTAPGYGYRGNQVGFDVSYRY